MGSKPFRIWDDSPKDPKSAWWSKSLSSIEEVFNSELKSNYRITKVLLTINADHDGGTSLSRVYMKAGFGSANGISKELLGKTRISQDSTDYPSSGIDITSYFDSKSYPFKLSKANGSYLSVNIYTSNNIVTDLCMNHADVVVTYDELHTVTVNVLPEGAGTVSGTGSYVGGTKATVTAVPSNGYKFIGFGNQNGVVTVTTNPYVFTVNNNITFYAIFEQISPPKFTSVEIKYLDKQVSPSNKVIANESFIISVGVT